MLLHIFPDASKWLESVEGLRANGDGPGFLSMLEAAQEQLLSPEDKKGPADRPPAGPKIQGSSLLRPNPQWVPSGRRRGQLDRPRVLHSPGSPRRSLRLGQAYAAPVQLCTFDEFWRAPWPGRGMVALFQKHGLYGRISDMGTFEALMAIPYAHSVWFLTMP
ncbi:hypothetical protein PoMZ_02668 [Pyricularia oryzae]|uniref:Uncharacterized protein n=1 Tax=Pyricularia oryzae TaxID=318829 RepID=A0A4P7N5V7_PYROR|nr:hypothetical protein PoMZ_02668 [Pyricularia oryzae]